MPSDKPGRRVFVAGARGQVARALERTYAARGDTVHCAGRATIDIADGAALNAQIVALQPDLVINAAAYTAVDNAEDERELAFRVNRDGAANIAAAARIVGAPLIHISTDYVFDGTKPAPYLESDPTNPLGVYGASKLAGEIAVAAAGSNNVILRTSWVCSPDGNNFVKTILRLAQERDEITVVDDQWGAPTFAVDLAGAICRLGDRLLAPESAAARFGVYHMTNSGETTWCRFAEAIVALSAASRTHACRVRAISTAEHPSRARRPANSRLDCSELRRKFDIKLPDWETSLAKCLGHLLPRNSKDSA